MNLLGGHTCLPWLQDVELSELERIDAQLASHHVDMRLPAEDHLLISRTSKMTRRQRVGVHRQELQPGVRNVVSAEVTDARIQDEIISGLRSGIGPAVVDDDRLMSDHPIIV